MKVLLQWSKSNPEDWVEIDSSIWASLPKKSVPTGGEPTDNLPGWFFDLNVQGVHFAGYDHVAVREIDEEYIEVIGWCDDPEDWPDGDKRAKVHRFGKLKPNTKAGGRIDTDQSVVSYYEGEEYERNVAIDWKGNHIVKHFSEFVPPDKSITIHGVWVTDELYEEHVQKATRRDFREWTDGVDPEFIDSDGKLVKNFRERGLFNKPRFTITYYLSADTSDLLTASDENRDLLASDPNSGSTIECRTADTTADSLVGQWVTESGVPGQSDWPSGDYRYSVQITNLASINGFTLRLHRVNAGGASQEQLGTHAYTTETGTLTDTFNLDPGQDSTHRYQLQIRFDRDMLHGPGTLEIDVGTADDFVDGPWSVAALTPITDTAEVETIASDATIVLEASTVETDLTSTQIIVSDVTVLVGEAICQTDAAEVETDSFEVVLILGAVTATTNTAEIQIFPLDITSPSAGPQICVVDPGLIVTQVADVRVYETESLKYGRYFGPVAVLSLAAEWHIYISWETSFTVQNDITLTTGYTWFQHSSAVGAKTRQVIYQRDGDDQTLTNALLVAESDLEDVTEIGNPLKFAHTYSSAPVLTGGNKYVVGVIASGETSAFRLYRDITDFEYGKHTTLADENAPSDLGGFSSQNGLYDTWIEAPLGKIHRLQPAGTGDANDFQLESPTGVKADRWKLINRAPYDQASASPGDYIYVSGIPSLDELYEFQDLSNISGNITAIRFWVTVNEYLSTNIGGPILNVGGTIYTTGYGGRGTGPGNKYGTQYGEWTKNPDTDLAWTESDINSLQAGWRHDGTLDTTAQALTAMWIDVEEDLDTGQTCIVDAAETETIVSDSIIVLGTAVCAVDTAEAEMITLSVTLDTPVLCAVDVGIIVLTVPDIRIYETEEAKYGFYFIPDGGAVNRYSTFGTTWTLVLPWAYPFEPSGNFTANTGYAHIFTSTTNAGSIKQAIYSTNRTDHSSTFLVASSDTVAVTQAGYQVIEMPYTYPFTFTGGDSYFVGVMGSGLAGSLSIHNTVAQFNASISSGNLAGGVPPADMTNANISNGPPRTWVANTDERIHRLQPTNTGDASDWSIESPTGEDRWKLVLGGPRDYPNDSDNWLSKYIYATGASTIDQLFHVQDLQGLQGPIKGVRLWFGGREYSGATTVRPILKIGSTTYIDTGDIGHRLTLNPNYWGEQYGEWVKNPDTDAAWTESDINDLQVGGRFYGAAGRSVSMSTLWLDVYDDITEPDIGQTAITDAAEIELINSDATIVLGTAVCVADAAETEMIVSDVALSTSVSCVVDVGIIVLTIPDVRIYETEVAKYGTYYLPGDDSAITYLWNTDWRLNIDWEFSFTPSGNITIETGFSYQRPNVSNAGVMKQVIYYKPDDTPANSVFVASSDTVAVTQNGIHLLEMPYSSPFTLTGGDTYVFGLMGSGTLSLRTVSSQVTWGHTVDQFSIAGGTPPSNLGSTANEIMALRNYIINTGENIHRLQATAVGDNDEWQIESPTGEDRWKLVLNGPRDIGESDPNWTTKYIYASGSVDKDQLFEIQDLQGLIGNITAIRLRVLGTEFVSTFDVRPLIKVNGTEFVITGDAGNRMPLSSQWGEQYGEWTLNPDTNLAWTESDIDSLQIGARYNADSATTAGYLGALWLDVFEDLNEPDTGQTAITDAAEIETIVSDLIIVPGKATCAVDAAIVETIVSDAVFSGTVSCAVDNAVIEIDSFAVAVETSVACTVDIAEIEIDSFDVTITAGATTSTVEAAEVQIITSDASLPGTGLSVETDLTELQTIALDVTVISGATTCSIDLGFVQTIASDVTVDAPVTCAVDVAKIEVIVSDVLVGEGALTSIVNAAEIETITQDVIVTTLTTVSTDLLEIEIIPQDVTVQVAAVSCSVDPGVIFVQAGDANAFAGLFVTLNTAESIVIVSDATIETGPTTATFDSAEQQIIASDVTVQVGEIICSTDISSVRTIAQDVSVVLEILATIDTPVLRALALDVGVSVGGTVSTASVGLVEALASDVTVTIGAVTCSVDLAEIQIIVQDVGATIGALAVIDHIELQTIANDPTIQVAAISCILDVGIIEIIAQDVVVGEGDITTTTEMPQVEIIVLDPNIIPGAINTLVEEAFIEFITSDVTVDAGDTVVTDTAEIQVLALDISCVGGPTTGTLDPGIIVVAIGTIRVDLAVILAANVAGGTFVNATNYVCQNISGYIIKNLNESITLRDAYPFRDTDIAAPMISYEFEFATESAVELGQTYVRYNLNYIIDVVGRTKTERDKYSELVYHALEVGKVGIEGIGYTQLVGFDNLGSYTVLNEDKRYQANTLRAKFDLVDSGL